MSELIQQLKRSNQSLREAEIEGLLYILSTSKSLTSNALIKLTGMPKETLRLFKHSISNLLKPTDDEALTLNANGEQLLSGLQLKPYTWTLLAYENKAFEDKLVEIRKELQLSPNRDFDQFFAEENSTYKKVRIMQEKGMVTGKSICLLGDDDLMSLGLGMLTPTYTKLTVLDIDDSLLGKIGAMAKRLNLPKIETGIYDARKPIAKAYTSKYEVVVTDPPYTPTGIKMFLNRALELLGSFQEANAKYIYLYYGNSFKSPEKTIKIQEIIASYGLLIEDKIDKFIRYNGAQSIGSASSLYILKLTPASKPQLNELPAEIYTYENTKEEKFPFVDHVVFKLNKVPQHVITSQKELLKRTDLFCREHKLKIVDTKVTRFKNGGITITHILSTSNLLVHTWPEYSALHLDLVTCAPIHNKDYLAQTLTKLFETLYIEEKRVY